MMESVFAGLNFPQKVIMILELAFLIGVLVIVVFRFLSGKKVSLNLKDGALNMGAETKAELATVQNVASSIFFQTLETVALMTQIKTKIILHDQMTYLEERLVLIKDNILESYRAKLRAKLTGPTRAPDAHIASTTSNQDYLFYKTLIDLMKEDMKSGIRILFLRNNFSRYNDKELDAYIEEKNELLLVKATQFISELYPSEKMLVSFDEVEETLSSVRKDIEADLTVVFKRAVEIHNTRHRQINELEAGLREKIKISYGVEVGLVNGSTFADIIKNDGRERDA